VGCAERWSDSKVSWRQQGLFGWATARFRGQGHSDGKVQGATQHFTSSSAIIPRFDYPAYNSAVYTIRFELCEYIYNWVTLWGGVMAGYFGLAGSHIWWRNRASKGYSCTAIWVWESLKGWAELHRRCRPSQQNCPYAVAGVNEAYGASIFGIYFGLGILYN